MSVCVCVCLCAVLQVFQGIPELLRPRARLHNKDIFTADEDAPHRPSAEGTPRVGSGALHGSPHTQRRPRLVAESQSRGFISISIETRVCCCSSCLQHPSCCPQTQTDPGGSLQGVETRRGAECLQRGAGEQVSN